LITSIVNNPVPMQGNNAEEFDFLCEVKIVGTSTTDDLWRLLCSRLNLHRLLHYNLVKSSELNKGDSIL